MLIGPKVHDGKQIALGGIMVSLSFVFKQFDKMNLKSAFSGALAFALIMGVLLGSFAIMKHFNINLASDNATGLSLLTLAISKAVKNLSGDKNDWSAGIRAAWHMLTFVGIIGAVLVGLGGLLEATGTGDDAARLIENTVPVLTALGDAIGSFFGGAIGGVLTGGLPIIAENLNTFSETLIPFVDNMAAIGDSGKLGSVVDGIKGLGEAVLYLNGVNLAENNVLTRLITGDLTDSGPTGRIVEDFKAMGEGIREFSESVAGLNDDSFDKIDAVGESIKVLGEALDAMPDQGGLIAEIFGDNTFELLGQSLDAFSMPFLRFANKMSIVDPTGVYPAMDATKKIIETMDSMKGNIGGAVAVLVGDNTLEKLAPSLTTYAGPFIEFCAAVNGVHTGGVYSAMAATRFSSK